MKNFFQAVFIMLCMLGVVYLLTGTDSCGKPMTEGCKSHSVIDLVPSVPAQAPSGFHP